MDTQEIVSELNRIQEAAYKGKLDSAEKSLWHSLCAVTKSASGKLRTSTDGSARRCGLRRGRARVASSTSRRNGLSLTHPKTSRVNAQRAVSSSFSERVLATMTLGRSRICLPMKCMAVDVVMDGTMKACSRFFCMNMGLKRFLCPEPSDGTSLQKRCRDAAESLPTLPGTLRELPTARSMIHGTPCMGDAITYTWKRDMSWSKEEVGALVNDRAEKSARYFFEKQLDNKKDF